MAQPQTIQTDTHADAHNVAFPPFETSTYAGQLLWLAITFGALYYLMSRYVVPQLTDIIETRRSTIARDLDEASAMKTRAEEAGQAYETALVEARTRAQALAQETRNKLAAETDAKRKAIEADLAARLADSEKIIAGSKAAAMANVREIAADTATAIVERLTGRAPNRAAIEAALDANAQR